MFPDVMRCSFIDSIRNMAITATLGNHILAQKLLHSEFSSMSEYSIPAKCNRTWTKGPGIHVYFCIHLGVFIVYLTASVAQAMLHRMVEWSVDNELWGMCKEAAVTYLRYYPGWTDWRKPRRTSARIAGVWAETWNRNLPNAIQEPYPFDSDVRC
jgi:hypothetical protein